jgi:NAD(P)-dependent dehydrogenase (short-subunit alcohol dehydrogenase family)
MDRAMNPFDLTGDIVLLTGAGGGIGQAIAAGLRDAGATVLGTDLRPADDVMAHDVTSAEDWARIAEDIRARHGKLSCLVNNAGYALTESIEATTLALWRRVQAVNVESILLGLHATLPLLREGAKGRRGGASVVNLSSIGGLRGAPFNAAYCASKAAVLLFTKCAAAEYAALRYDIRVNSVHPGGIDTAMMNGIMARYVELGGAPTQQVAREAVEHRHPMGRLGTPEEIAGGVVYLCAPAASFVTGAELSIDGGFAAV